MRHGWGRVVNVTTSLGTMLNAGSPTYGPSKAALEALSAIMAKDLDGTGVTVNVLVPGGLTNTPMVSDDAGFDRAKMIQPEVMAPPLIWLVSDAAGKVTGRRFLAVHWNPNLPPEQAAEIAGDPPPENWAISVESPRGYDARREDDPCGGSASPRSRSSQS
jgi:short chain dehydrogenase